MRLSRLAVLLTVFAGMSLPAAAQYTTRGGEAGSSVPRSTDAAPAAGTASGFTSRSASKAKARPAAGQAIFRPRPKEETVPESTENDDELPSFEVLEGKTSGTPQENVPPPPPPKGEIWFYISGFEYRDLTGRTMNCIWKVVVQNRTDTPIKRMELSYQLLDVDFVVRLNPVEPNGSAVTAHAAYTPKCPAMSHVRPKVGVIKCKMGPLTDQECLRYIIVK